MTTTIAVVARCRRPRDGLSPVSLRHRSSHFILSLPHRLSLSLFLFLRRTTTRRRWWWFVMLIDRGGCGEDGGSDVWSRRRVV
ncbi:hypothetical protein HanIR_Chr13g0650021 [Helianthus annuus]|nr:hypothetical protein HanIR_Chr13g0650021 [Helianthus annuus]